MYKIKRTFVIGYKTNRKHIMPTQNTVTQHQLEMANISWCNANNPNSKLTTIEIFNHLKTIYGWGYDTIVKSTIALNIIRFCNKPNLTDEQKITILGVCDVLTPMVLTAVASDMVLPATPNHDVAEMLHFWLLEILMQCVTHIDGNPNNSQEVAAICSMVEI
jgi:hypothetical protein